METTNELISKVLDDITKLKEWATADYEASLEAHAEGQAEDDLIRMHLLDKAWEYVSASFK